MDAENGKRNCPDPRIFSSSMADRLPEAIFFEIILKLPMRSIVMSKCVCKTWCDLLSDARFTKLNFAQAKPCPLIRNRHHTRISRSLYLLKPEEYNHGFCTGHRVRHDCLRQKVSTVFKIPLRNTNLLLKEPVFADVVFGVKGNNIHGSYKGNSTTVDHTFGSISSCNGLLCLSDLGCSIVVCNPITGEYVKLPEPYEYNRPEICFGLSLKTNQYKVLRLFRNLGKESKIHTLGTSTWRSIGVVPSKLRLMYGYQASNICFNGVIHWFCSDKETDRHNGCIACFDLEAERFQSSIQVPKGLSERLNSVGMDVLGNRLCVYERVGNILTLWTMGEYGDAESWKRLLSVDIARVPRHKPLSRSSDGYFMTFYDEKSRKTALMIQCDQSGELTFRRLESRVETKFEAIAHTPSLVSLKDMMDTSSIEILNVYQRCGKIKLMEDNHHVYLGCANNS